jgi:RNA polymerase sigma factor (sigma-70 family)
VALDRLVALHDRRLRRVARAYGLSTWDVDDVVQATWLQYLEHGDALREPSALGAWLETTARRLSLRVLQRRVRERLTETGDASAAGAGAEPEPELLAAERRALLFGALAGLPDRQRRLMRMLVLRPELSYEEVGRRLAMPVGSIGPTRARCLDRLSRDVRLRALRAA